MLKFFAISFEDKASMQADSLWPNSTQRHYGQATTSLNTRRLWPKDLETPATNLSPGIKATLPLDGLNLWHALVANKTLGFGWRGDVGLQPFRTAAILWRGLRLVFG